jgi:hypothetical protein
VQEVSRPPEQFVLSRTKVDPAGEFLVSAVHHGGGAGDTVYQLLSCPTGLDVCDYMGGIDPGEKRPPEIRSSAGAAILLLNPSDTVWSLTNTTNYLLRGPNRHILLRYRVGAADRSDQMAVSAKGADR